MTEFLLNLTFFNASGLLALFVLLIPIIIHFINPNKATLIWVASIRLIKTNDVKRIFQIKWLEKLLLLIRLILFTLITLLLAKPVFFETVKMIDEEHHLYSIDWLENTSDIEFKKIKDNRNVENKNKHFILEAINKNSYSNFEQLFDSFNNRSEKQLIFSSNQTSFIAELEQRVIIPRLTHLYLTNRTSNYTETKLTSRSNYPIAIHFKSINKKTINKPISIEIIYDNKLAHEKELLELALETIKENSLLSINVLTSIVDSKNREVSADLIFLLGGLKALKNNSEKVLVEPIEKGMRFTQSNGYVKTWSYSSPVELIAMLSQLINNLDVVSETEVLDNKTIFRLFNGDNDSATGDSNINIKNSTLTPKSLQQYLFFLFCLFLLIERWIVLRGIKSHA